MNLNKQTDNIVKLFALNLDRIMQRLLSDADFGSPRFLSKIDSIIKELGKLRTYSNDWGEKIIEQLYNETQDESHKSLLLLLGASAISMPGMDKVNNQAKGLLINGPDTGFKTAINAVVTNMQNKLRHLQYPLRLLWIEKSVLVDTTSAGTFVEESDLTPDSLRALAQKSKGNIAALSDYAKKLNPNNLIKKMLEIPFVKIPTRQSKAGYRLLRIDKYLKLMVHNKFRQVISTARRYKMLQFGQEVIMINNLKPLHDDACAIYIGKAYALTKRAAESYGIPHVSSLPSSGAPFHPNCRHSEKMFNVNRQTEAQLAAAFHKTPRWALNKSWEAVNSEYYKRGGAGSIKGVNPNYSKSSGSSKKRKRA